MQEFAEQLCEQSVCQQFFASLKNCCGSKNRNSRPELGKLDNKIYMEASGDLASLVEAEYCWFVCVQSQFPLPLTSIHDWCYISRVKRCFPVQTRAELGSRTESWDQLRVPGAANRPFLCWSHGEVAFGLVSGRPNICLNAFDWWIVTAPVMMMDHTESCLVLPGQLYGGGSVMYLHCSVFRACVSFSSRGLG